jgi:antitoxin (DNA-binding transcriptional repressor) of toxin-antitoxin stability system
MTRNIRNMRTHRKAGDPRVSRARVSATEAAKNFGRLVDRVREERVTYDIERGGKPVAKIAPADRVSFTMGDFKALVGELPRGDDEYLKIVGRTSARRNRPRVRRNPWER